MPLTADDEPLYVTVKAPGKVLTAAYILIQSPQNAFSSSFAKTGRQKINWFISLPKGVQGYSWGEGGEEGEEFGRSVKSELGIGPPGETDGSGKDASRGVRSAGTSQNFREREGTIRELGRGCL